MGRLLIILPKYRFRKTSCARAPHLLIVIIHLQDDVKCEYQFRSEFIVTHKNKHRLLPTYLLGPRKSRSYSSHIREPWISLFLV